MSQLNYIMQFIFYQYVICAYLCSVTEEIRALLTIIFPPLQKQF